jgi:dephospho-CoA kinase
MASTTKQNTITIGVTGGIGCGMSSVSAILAQWGGILINGDRVARELMEKGQPAYQETVKVFGTDYVKPDGDFDRKKLGQLVFSSREKLMQLDQAVHPFWIEKIKTLITETRAHLQPGQFIILDAALIIETGLEAQVDKLIVVTAPMKDRRSRICKRDGLDECQADQRIYSQMPVKQKAAKADYVIDNSGTLQELEEKMQAIRTSLFSTDVENENKGDK